MASTPDTGRSVPSKDNSPRMQKGSAFSFGSVSMAASMPTAIGRSYSGPSFFISAGAKFTVIRWAGYSYPLFFSALRTRSLASLTAASGRPTSSNAGRPPEISISTDTGYPTMPSNPKLLIFDSKTSFPPYLLLEKPPGRHPA